MKIKIKRLQGKVPDYFGTLLENNQSSNVDEFLKSLSINTFYDMGEWYARVDEPIAENLLKLIYGLNDNQTVKWMNKRVIRPWQIHEIIIDAGYEVSDYSIIEEDNEYFLISSKEIATLVKLVMDNS